MINEPKRPTDKPLRLPLQDVYKIGGIGTPLTSLQKSSPSRCTIRPFWRLYRAMSASTSRMSPSRISSMVSLPPTLRTILAKEAANFTSQIGNCYVPVIDCHTFHIAIKFAELLTKMDGQSGKELEKEPKFLKNGDAGMVKMVLTKPMVVETFSAYPPLGHFSGRDMRDAENRRCRRYQDRREEGTQRR